MVAVDDSSLQADSQPKVQVGWLCLKVGNCLALSYIHQMNCVNSRNNLCHDDDTVHIVKIYNYNYNYNHNNYYFFKNLYPR